MFLDSYTFPILFELTLAILSAMVVTSGALFYLRRVRLERPAIGTFNHRDIRILFCFIILLPFVYVVLPRDALTSFLVLTFSGAISIGFRPVLSRTQLWLGIGLVIGANIWLSRTMLGTILGWQLAWATTDILVILAAISVSNLYIQGGMRLRHVAWIALILAIYDLAFTRYVPLTNKLTEQFLGYPLDPSIGMRIGLYNASIGLGDLLVYAMFLIAAFKAYGRFAARVAFSLIVVFGAIAPALAPLVIHSFLDARTDLVVPAQTLFGPAAFIAYRWMKKRYGPERTMAQFLASNDVRRPTPAADTALEPVTEPAVAPAPA
ncbi:MAG TPA: hypothetical protein VJ851_13345 [Jatrophihabitans sp.]|nr:hypothetical protein [Jatrophihabitans sp.]